MYRNNRNNRSGGFAARGNDRKRRGDGMEGGGRPPKRGPHQDIPLETDSFESGTRDALERITGIALRRLEVHKRAEEVLAELKKLGFTEKEQIENLLKGDEGEEEAELPREAPPDNEVEMKDVGEDTHVPETGEKSPFPKLPSESGSESEAEAKSDEMCASFWDPDPSKACTDSACAKSHVFEAVWCSTRQHLALPHVLERYNEESLSPAQLDAVNDHRSGLSAEERPVFDDRVKALG